MSGRARGLAGRAPLVRSNVGRERAFNGDKFRAHLLRAESCGAALNRAERRELDRLKRRSGETRGR